MMQFIFFLLFIFLKNGLEWISAAKIGFLHSGGISC